jgi:lysyl-tRNA synthetase class 2
VVSLLRRSLEDKGFVEVETPVLHAIPGGATAKPFVTHHNALDTDLYLRIAIELHLKRLVVGGMERVFEIGRVFRNEGLSPRHQPEFTMLELYQAYADYHDMMEHCEQIVSGAAQELLGTTVVQYAGHEIDLKAPWPRLPMLEAIQQYGGIDVRAHPNQADLYAAAGRAGVELAIDTPRAKIVDELVKRFVEPHLIQPTHLIDYPVEMSPLAKRKPGADDLVERFESYIAGVEISNAFTELNDPLDQRARFEQQQADRAEGDEEAHTFDADFLLALEHGMPPTGGMGIGIDRVTMALSGAPSIRDVVLFPHMRRSEG